MRQRGEPRTYVEVESVSGSRDLHATDAMPGGLGSGRVRRYLGTNSAAVDNPAAGGTRRGEIVGVVW